MKQLDHEASKTFESTRDAHSRADLNQNSFRSVNVNLKLPSFVDGGIQ